MYPFRDTFMKAGGISLENQTSNLCNDLRRRKSVGKPLCDCNITPLGSAAS